MIIVVCVVEVTMCLWDVRRLMRPAGHAKGGFGMMVG